MNVVKSGRERERERERERDRETTMSGPECCSNPLVLNRSDVAGHVEKLGGLDSYVAGSPDSKLAIVLISDLFGYEAPNLRKIADKYAAAGFFVVVPDFFHGDPYVTENAESRPIKVWVKDHEPVKASVEAKSFIEALKSKGISSVGAAGFCWGAKVVVELAKCNFIEAAVILHPALVSVEDIKEVKVPISILGAEIDKVSPPELLKQFEDVLAAKYGADFFAVKIFPNASHGWAVRYDVNDEVVFKKAEEAHNDMLEWFNKHLKSEGLQQNT